MHLNDLGSWCVAWLQYGETSGHRMAHAFFFSRVEAERFRDAKGGELYTKHVDGSLKRV